MRAFHITVNISKNVPLNWYSSMKKVKYFDDFWCRKLTLKVNFGTFWHLPITPILKIQQFSFGYVDFRQKIFPILYSPLEKLTTRITILSMVKNIWTHSKKYWRRSKDFDHGQNIFEVTYGIGIKWFILQWWFRGKAPAFVGKLH